MKKTLDKFIKLRWWLIGLLILVIFNMQTAELWVVVPQYYHLIEFLIYLIILMLGGAFLEMLLRASDRQERTLRILDYKHRLSQALAGSDDWDVLIFELAKFPVSVSSVEASCLFIRDGISGDFEHAAYWHTDGKDLPGYTAERAYPTWVNQIHAAGKKFHRCLQTGDLVRLSSSPVEYCLPIRQEENLLAFIRFKLSPGRELSPEEDEVYQNVGDEMALALTVGQARKTSYEMLSSQAALAERRTVSHYLHDNLGQNLGYLRLKLDQLLAERDQLSMQLITTDLERMRDAANESYDIVRGTLETIQPKTLPHLMNLLEDLARKVAERANFVVNFEVKGRPFIFKDDMQSAIFYVCHEVLSNVEKHSRASRVDIIFEWRDDNFQLKISDNGVGFNPQAVNRDHHFGLEIVHERINNINGHITVKTSENSGTVVVISVPTHPIGPL